MSYIKMIALTVYISLVGGVSYAQDLALRDHVGIRKGLQVAGAAYLISQKCERISIRKVKGFFYLNGLKNEARSLGYSQENIESYVSNKEEKKKLEAEVLVLLEQKGLQKDYAQSYCHIGDVEVASGTEIGSLLY